jgi:nitrogenase subunit NifH
MALLKEQLKSTNKSKLANATRVRNVIIKHDSNMVTGNWKRAYMILSAGDPKQRSIRGLLKSINQDTAIRMVKEHKRKQENET